MTAEFEGTQNSVLDLPTVQEEHKRIDCIRHPVDSICGLEEVLCGVGKEPDLLNLVKNCRIVSAFQSLLSSC